MFFGVFQFAYEGKTDEGKEFMIDEDLGLFRLFVAFRDTATCRHSEIKQTKTTMKQDFLGKHCKNKASRTD